MAFPDLSQHNGSVDFRRLHAACDPKIVAVRCAYDGPGDVLQVDDLFTRERVKAVYDAGMVLLPYIYSVPMNKRRGRDDAAFALKVCKDRGVQFRPGIDGRIVNDEEESLVGAEGNTRHMEDFRVGAGPAGAVGYSSISGLSYTRKIDIPCWVANPGATPGRPNGLPSFANSWVLHQFDFTGRIAGTNGDVDLNYVRPGAFAQLLVPGPTRPPIIGRKGKSGVEVYQGPWVHSYTKGLIFLGYLSGQPRDYFTRGTEQATREFQCNHRRFGLSDTGVVDAKTLAVFRSAVAWRKAHPHG